MRIKVSTKFSDFKHQMDSNHDDQLQQVLDQELCDQMNWKLLEDMIDMEETLYSDFSFKINMMRYHEN